MSLPLLVSYRQTLVERLLGEGVDIAVTDTQSRTALLHSVIRKHDTITHLLLAHHSALVRNRLNATKRRKSDRRLRAVHSLQRAEGGREQGGDAGAGGGGIPDTVSDLQVCRFALLVWQTPA